MRNTFDVAVIGAGIVGVATALHLLQRGQRVVLVDRREAGRETSGGNAGIIGTSYLLPFGFPAWRDIPAILLDRATSARIHYPSLPRYVPWLFDFYLNSNAKMRQKNGAFLRPLLAQAVGEHRALMRGTDAERHLCKTGRAVLYRSEEGFAESAFERSVALRAGEPFEILDRAAFRALEPSINPAFHKVVLWPGSPRLDNPVAVTTAYAERFVREGGVFRQSEARGLIANQGGWLIETADDTIEAKQIVMCAGPWATDLLAPLGYRFPLALKRGYHQHFSAVGNASLSHSIADAAFGYLLTPMEQGYRIITGAEFAHREAPSTPKQIDRILPHARELFPLGEPVEEQALHANRPCLPDSLPIIGRAPDHAGLWFNFGHGHVGLTSGPASGRLIAEMLTGAKTFCDPAPYRAERFKK